MPIISTETGEPIAAIVVGFKPVESGRHRAGFGIKSGIWLKDRLHLPSLPGSTQAAIWVASMTRAMCLARSGGAELSRRGEWRPASSFSTSSLNPNSLFPPAYEVCIYSLSRFAHAAATTALANPRVRARCSCSARSPPVTLPRPGLSVPVKKLALDSAEDRAERERAEAALERTSKELQRSARFSADTSHQLKTPVTVLRAGLEELLAHENLTPEGREEIAALIHQTFRITSIIEDLLLALADGRRPPPNRL